MNLYFLIKIYNILNFWKNRKSLVNFNFKILLKSASFFLLKFKIKIKILNESVFNSGNIWWYYFIPTPFNIYRLVRKHHTRKQCIRFQQLFISLGSNKCSKIQQIDTKETKVKWQNSFRVLPALFSKYHDVKESLRIKDHFRLAEKIDHLMRSNFLIVFWYC